MRTQIIRSQRTGPKMKILKTTTTKSETSATIDLFEDRELPRKIKRKVAEAVGEFLVEQTLTRVASTTSPIQGEGNFKALSKLYKKKKLEQVGTGTPNLEFQGDMLDQLGVKATDT